MSRIKTIITALLLTASATSAATQELHLVFAACAGRHSAEVEHAYLMGQKAQEHEAHMLTFASLVEATIPTGEGSRTLHHRIAAKMAQAQLLTVRDFVLDQDRSEAAQQSLTTHLASCGRLLLES